jgi:hypothetical protein
VDQLKALTHQDVRSWALQHDFVLLLTHASPTLLNPSLLGVAFSPTQHVLATLGAEGCDVRLWDIDLQTLLQARPSSTTSTHQRAREKKRWKAAWCWVPETPATTSDSVTDG